jgi:hypothetical protein
LGGGSDQNGESLEVTTVKFEREAEDDALEAYDWYEQQRPGLGVRFRDALDAAVALWPTCCALIAQRKETPRAGCCPSTLDPWLCKYCTPLQAPIASGASCPTPVRNPSL